MKYSNPRSHFHWRSLIAVAAACGVTFSSLSGLASDSGAGSIRKSTKEARKSGLAVDGALGFTIGNKNLINGPNSEWNKFWQDAFVRVTYTTADGRTVTDAKLNAESVLARSLNMNGSAMKGVTVDDEELRHIVEKATVKRYIKGSALDQDSQSFAVEAGVGEVAPGMSAIKRGENDIFILQSEQYKALRLDQRLLVNLEYDIPETGTHVSVSVFNGEKSGAINPQGDFETSDFMNIQMHGLSESLSGAVNLRQALGSLKSELKDFGINLGYAKVRGIVPGGGDSDRITVGADYYKELLNDLTIAGLVQYAYIKDEGNDGRNSVLAQLQVEKGKWLAYARADWTETKNGQGQVNGVTTGAVGVGYNAIYKSIAMRPQLELFVRDGLADKVDTGLLGSIRFSGAIHRDLTPKKGG